MLNLENFVALETQKLAAVNGTSTNTQFTGAGAGKNIKSCLVTNDTDKTIIVAFQQGSAPAPAATTGDRIQPIKAGTAAVVNKGDADYCAAITADGASATGTLYFTAGMGS